jgi:hypothetical protein
VLRAAGSRANIPSPASCPVEEPSLHWVTLRRVRLFAQTCIAVAAVVLTGCGASDERAWNGPPAPDAEGNVAVDTFEAYREAVDEDWESAPVLVATEFVKVEDRAAAKTSISGNASGTGDEGQRVTIVFTELLDDAVNAERWVLSIEPAGESFRLVSARRTQRCQPGRGQEEFAPEPCV